MKKNIVILFLLIAGWGYAQKPAYLASKFTNGLRDFLFIMIVVLRQGIIYPDFFLGWRKIEWKLRKLYESHLP